MDKKTTSNILLGMFVVVGLTVFLLLIFNMGGGQGIFSSQYTLNGRFAHVKGLHFGSEVALSGLRVGTVKAITVAIDGTKDLLVEMAINKKVMEHIRQDSKALVVTQGVLGDKYIEITVGSPDKEALKEGAFIQTNEIQDLFTKGGGLVDSLKDQFGKGGEMDNLIRHLSKIAQRLDAMTSGPQTSKSLLHEVTQGNGGEKLGRSLAKLESILTKIDNGEGSLGALINDPTVYEDLKSIMGGAKRSTILKYFMKQFMESGEKTPKK